MVDLAESLNRVQVNPQAGQQGPPVAPKSWWQQMGDYVGGTNLSDFGEAASRIMPLTAVLRAADDINKVQQAKPDQPALDTYKEGLAPQRFVAAQGAHLPTDIVSGGMSLYPMAVGLGNQLSNMAGGPMVDLGQHEVLAAADRVKESSTPFVDTLAGRPSESDALLRGSPEEMAGHLSRTIGQFVPMGVPSWLSNLAKFNTGSKYLNAAGNTLRNVVETVTPLSIAANPTLSTVLKNAAFGTGAGVLFEGASDIERQREQERREAASLSGAPPFTASNQPSSTSNQQATAGTQGPAKAPNKLDMVAASTDGVARAATDTMIDAVPHSPRLAGIPSTGSDWGDAALFAIGSMSLLGLARRDLARKAADASGYTKYTTSYDPKNPLEATTQTIGTMQRQQHLNRTESMTVTREAIQREMGDTASQARENVREWEEQLAKRQGASVSVRSGTFVHNGEFMDNPNIKLMRPYSDHAVEVAQGITDPQREAYTRVLHYQNELDNRMDALRKHFNTPGMTLYTAPHEGIAHNLYDLQVRDLQNQIRMDRSDPVVARLTDEYHLINTKLGQYAAAEGRFHPTDVARFQREHPHYVPPNIPETGSFLNPQLRSNQVMSTNPATGVKTPIPGRYEPGGSRTLKELGDPLILQSRYADEIFRSTEGKKAQRDYFNYLIDQRSRGSQIARDMLGRDRALDRAADYKTVQWRDLYGNLRRTEINDAVLRDSLKGLTNPTALQMSRGIGSRLANWVESGAVGPFSLLGGQTFPIRSALYSVTGGTVLSRPPGISMGYLDKGVRTLTEKLSGGKVSIGMRGDPTMAADALLYRAPKNVIAVSAEHLGNALHNAVLKDSMVARIMSPARAARWADAMRNHYMNSAMYQDVRRGLTGPSSMESMNRGNVYADPAQAFRAKGKLALTYNFVRDNMHAISSAPGQTIRALNKNVPEWRVDSAIRNLSGDIGRSGAFRKIGGEPGVAPTGQFTRSTPWGNVFLQSGAKTIASFNPRNPKEVAAVVYGITQSMVAPSAMLAIWNALLGEEYAKYHYHTQTAEKRASSWYIGIPGHPANEGWHVPMEPWMRPFKHLGEVIAGHFLGAYSGELYKSENEAIRKAMGESVYHRDLSMDKDSIPNVLLHQVLLPPVPTWITGPAALLGVEIRGYGDVKMPGPTKRNIGYVEGSGKDPGAEILDRAHQDWWDTAAQAIGATGAQATLDYITEVTGAGKFGAGPWEKFQRFGQAYGQRLGDSLDVAGSGPLFDHARGIVPSHVGVSVLARDKSNVMNEIANAYSSTMDRGVPKGDFVGGVRRGFTALMGPGPQGPPDTQTADFSSDVKRMYATLQPARTAVNDKYTELSAVKHNYAYSPEERRARSEVIASEIINANKAILADIRRYEAILSQDYKMKITFDDYDARKPISQQFKPLTGGVSRPGDYPIVR